MTDIAPPPATGIWYDLDVTASNVLHQLRLQGGDVDATRIRNLIPEAALSIDQYVDGTTVIDGPPPAPDFQGTLERYTIELYRSDPSGEFMTTSPGALHLRDILDAGIGHRKQRFAVS